MAAREEGETGPKSPYKLVSCNTNPEGARRLVGQVIGGLSDEYAVEHVANITKIDEVRGIVEVYKPDILITASMWSPDEAHRIVAIAKEVVPDLKTMSVPQGLRVEQGPDAVVEYAKDHLRKILGQNG